MSDADDWLPALTRLADVGGDRAEYIEQTYAIFRRDFVESQPRFQGLWVRCRRDPIEEDGKEAGFWHCVSEGPNESDRVPDLGRCARIAWIRAMLENSGKAGIDVWKNDRQGDERTLVWYREEFLVVLAIRRRTRDAFRYYQLITAYETKEGHRKSKLRRREMTT